MIKRVIQARFLPFTLPEDFMAISCPERTLFFTPPTFLFTVLGGRAPAQTPK
jgi:hypothetical protein